MRWTALLLLLMLTSQAQARTWTVEKDGSGDFSVIQDAVDVSTPGDTVLVGPGRYDDFIAYPFPSGIVEAVVRVSVDLLTIRGTERDSVVIGPEVNPPSTQVHPYVCIRLDDQSAFRIESLILENTYLGVQAIGQMFASNVIVRNHDKDGIRNRGTGQLIVVNSRFISNGADAIVADPLCESAYVDSCVFIDNRTGFLNIGTSASLVENSRFESRHEIGVGVDIQQGGRGVVQNCWFGYHSSVPLIFSTKARAELYDNVCEVSEYVSLGAISDSFVSGSGNVFKGGSWATVEVRDRAAVSLSNNDFYLATSPCILSVRNYGLPPVAPIDFRNNWWGTADSTTIANLIRYENVDPALGVEALWQPYLTGPVPVEQETMGGFKSRFRRN